MRDPSLDFRLHHLSLVHDYEDIMSSTQIYEVCCILESICFVDMSTAIVCKGDHCSPISN